MAYDGEGPGGYDGLRPGYPNVGQPPHIARQSEAQRRANAGLAPVKRCTALTGLASTGLALRCGQTAARAFVTALYPDGPELRLCAAHDRRFYAAAISAARTIGADEATAREVNARNVIAFEKLCDEWRGARDCGCR